MSPRRRSTLPTAAEFHEDWWPRIGKHMWIERVNLDVGRGGSFLEIRGELKAQPNEGGGRVERLMFMDVLDQALAELADLGAVHTRHPDVRIRGQAVHSVDKPSDFAALECEVEFYIVMQP